MTKGQKLNSLKTLLVEIAEVTNLTYVKRKALIDEAIRSGLEEKDTYVVLKGSAKSSTIGYYEVAEMLTLVEAAMRKLIKGAVKSAPAKKAIKKRAVKLTIEQEIAEELRGTEDEIGDVSCFSEVC
jgi:hypothetical protein